MNTGHVKPLVINAYGCEGAVIDEVQYLGTPTSSEYSHTTIIGVNIKHGCGTGSGNLALNEEHCLENSFETSMDTTLEINWGFSVTHGIAVDAKPLGVGVSTSFETSWSVGGSVAQSFGNAWASSNSKCRTAQGTINFEHPGAAVLAGYVDKFKVAEHTRPTRLKMTCPDNRKMELMVNMRVKGSTYSSVNFISHSEMYPNGNDNCATVGACLQKLNREKQKEYAAYLDAEEQIHKIFRQCLGQGAIGR